MRPATEELTGRPWAAVTGASSGIGAAFVRALAADGYDVLLVARRPEPLAVAAAGLPAATEVLAADLSVPEGLARVEARLRERPVRLLVNNAATGRWGPFDEQDPEVLEETIGVNVLAGARLARAVLPGMLAAGGGGLITVSSPAGARASPMLAAYGAAKAFTDALDVSLRAELATRGAHGITVTTVWPGWTRTGFHDRLGQDVLDVPPELWSTPDAVARAGLDAHRRGRATVRVPRPTVHQRLVEQTRRARQHLPAPVKTLGRRTRAALRVRPTDR